MVRHILSAECQQCSEPDYGNRIQDKHDDSVVVSSRITYRWEETLTDSRRRNGQRFRLARIIQTGLATP